MRESNSSAAPTPKRARFAVLPVARWAFVLLALLTAGDGWAAKPAQKAPQSPAPLRCTALQLSTTQATLPALEVAAVLTLHNASSSPAVIIKPALGFFSATDKEKWRDVSTSIYTEPDAANPWFIAPGQTAQLKFKVQLLHDTPAGKLRVAPRIEYFSQADNAFPQLTDFGKPGKSWQLDNPAPKFNATATLVQGESTPPGAKSAVQLAVRDNRLKGRITLQSPGSTLRPNTAYVAGVLYKSDRSGWDSPINKGASITEYDDKGAIRAQPLHLFEVPYWSWELARFKSTPQSARASMEVWNRGWALKQNGQSWYGAAFLVPQDKMQVLDAAAPEPVINVTATPSPKIVFLGDDRPQAGEGGDWIGRYGNESFILCGMQSPQDIVGGRLLPKRRWAKGKNKLAPTVLVWTDWKGEFFYEVLTGDPKEPPRHWIPIDELTTDDPRALINPLEGGRRYSSWDDRGEVHPFDGKGPDLIVNLEIPPGLHRLTLYFVDWDFYDTARPRAQRLFISDATKDEKVGLLCSGYVSDFGQGVYKVYGVSGPSKLRLRIQKDKSVCAVLSGIFLDEISLPDSAHVLPPGGRRSAALQQAAQEWEALRTLQSTPEKFLASSKRMKEVLRLANQAVHSKSQDEKAAAEWLRWQTTSTLVVAPWVKEPAFKNYVASRPLANAVDARSLVRKLLDAGEVGLARQVTQTWLEMADRDGLSPWSEAIAWFVKRDTNYASHLAESFVRQTKTQGEKPQMGLQIADALLRLAQDERHNGPGNAYRVAAACYSAVRESFGEQTLGAEEAFRLAEAKADSPGYRFATPRLAVAAYRQYVERWPKGKYAAYAYSRLVRLADTFAVPEYPQARFYAEAGADAAHALLAMADASNSNNDTVQPMKWGSGANDAQGEVISPLNAAQQMAAIFTRLNDKAAAEHWQQEIRKRTLTNVLAELGQRKPNGN